MKSSLEMIDKWFDAMLAIFLALMGIFIFGNVFLRYVFNMGLTWAEEMSRFLFRLAGLPGVQSGP